MKKLLLIAATSATLINMSSCCNPNAGSGKSSVDSLAPRRFHDMDYHGEHTVSNPILNTALPPDALVYANANLAINNFTATYMPPATGVLSPSTTFLFNANELLQYIDSVQSPMLQFFLAVDPGTTNVYMVAAMINQNGNTDYLQKPAGTFYVLKSCQPSPLPSPSSPITNTLTPPGINVTGFYYEGLPIADLPITTGAATMISSYQNGTTTGAILRSAWLYNANDLEAFIKNAPAPGMNYIQVIPCLKGKMMDIVICGLQYQPTANAYTQMFFSYDKTPCVLENGDPCPICAANSQVALTAPGL